MSSIGGPKGPADPSTRGRILPFVRPDTTTGSTSATTSVPVAAPALDATRTPAEPGARFDSTPGQQRPLDVPGESARQSQVRARLLALGLDPDSAPTSRRIKSAATSGPAQVSTDAGPVLSGSVAVESRQGLHKLDGIVRIGGDLTIHEATLKNADLLALRALQSVEGRLTFEGLSST